MASELSRPHSTNGHTHHGSIKGHGRPRGPSRAWSQLCPISRTEEGVCLLSALRRRATQEGAGREIAGPRGPRACISTGLALGEAGAEPGGCQGKGWPGRPGVSLGIPLKTGRPKEARGSSWVQAGVHAAKGSSQQQLQTPGFLLKPLAVLAADLVRTPVPAARVPAPLTLSSLPAPGVAVLLAVQRHPGVDGNPSCCR